MRVALAAACILLLAPVTLAHSVPVAQDCCDPAMGGRLAEAPTQVKVVFTEGLDAASSYLQVHDAKGERVDLCDTQVTQNPPTMAVHLRTGLPDGAYTVDWHTASTQDGHGTANSFSFAVGAFEPGATRATRTGDVDAYQAASRFVAFTGLALGFGGAMVLALVPGATRRLATNALAAGALLHLLGIAGLIAATARASPVIDGCSSVASLPRFLGTDVGRGLYVRAVVGLAALAVLLPQFFLRRALRLPVISGAALLVLAGALASRNAHASGAGLAGTTVDFVHLAAAATWTGGLLVLALQLRRWAKDHRPLDEVRAAGTRFGTVAMACVIVLAAAGTMDALFVAQAQLTSSFWPTLLHGWGLFLLAKVLVAAVMVALAALNRYVFLEPGTTKGLAGRLQAMAARVRLAPMTTTATARPFATWVRAEAMLGLLTLLLAGLLTSVSPPPLVGPPSAQGYDGAGQHVTVALHFDAPPMAGSSPAIRFFLAYRNGTPIVANDVAVCGDHCVRTVLGHGNETRIARATGGGWWTVDPYVFTRSGQEILTVKVQSASFFADAAAVRFVVG